MPLSMDADLRRLAAILRLAFPGIGAIEPLSVLGEGFRSVAVETAGGMVVRVGRSAEALDGYLREHRTLPFLREFLGDSIPQTGAFVSSSDELPYGAHAYPKLPGGTPRFGINAPDSLAEDLGRFMARLHSIPAREAKSAGLPEVDSLQRLLGARPIIAQALEELLSGEELRRVDTWWDRLERDDRMRTFDDRVCHHDLWHDNLLVDRDGRLSGILDWSHAEVGDPAHDFSAPYYFGDRFFRLLVLAYRAAHGGFDDEEAYRSLRYWEGREFGGIAWAIENDDPDELEDGIRKLRSGPLLAPHL